MTAPACKCGAPQMASVVLGETYYAGRCAACACAAEGVYVRELAEAGRQPEPGRVRGGPRWRGFWGSQRLPHAAPAPLEGEVVEEITMFRSNRSTGTP